MKILQKITMIIFILVMSVTVINAFAAEDINNITANNNDTSVVITEDKERDIRLQIHKNDDGKISVFLPDDSEQVFTADNSIDITIKNKNADSEENSLKIMIVIMFCGMAVIMIFLMIASL